jgi:hypothetical protein
MIQTYEVIYRNAEDEGGDIKVRYPPSLDT